MTDSAYLLKGFNQSGTLRISWSKSIYYPVHFISRFPVSSISIEM